MATHDKTFELYTPDIKKVPSLPKTIQESRNIVAGRRKITLAGNRNNTREHSLQIFMDFYPLVTKQLRQSPTPLLV